MFSFGGKGQKNDDSNVAMLDHEEYVARNNSCSSLDDDDLDGDLNLSDDGEDGQMRRGQLR